MNDNDQVLNEYFIIERGEYTGKDWSMFFGTSMVDNEDYTITTNKINASNLHNYCVDAKDDAELVCKLLNMHFNGKINIPVVLSQKEIDRQIKKARLEVLEDNIGFIETLMTFGACLSDIQETLRIERIKLLKRKQEIGE